ncbi:MAG: metallophosphoesterase [Allorhizobium sp.]
MTPETAPVLRIGVVADPQYAPIASNPLTGRYYRSSLEKLSEAIAHFNGEDLDFVVTLGDIIDRDWLSFDDILPLYARCRHRCLFLAGNHDFAVAPEFLGKVHARLGMPSPYYDFETSGCRFIIIDGNEVSLFAPPAGDPRRDEAEARLAALVAEGADNAHPWNAGISAAQRDWLAQRLSLASAGGEKVVVMGHYPLYPHGDHNLWGGQEIAELLSEAGVAAYFCGHYHVGNYGRLGPTHFVNFCGMVDTEHQNAFAVVEIHADRIVIKGSGREPSRILALQV